MRRVAEACEAWIPYYYGFGYELHKDRRPELYAVGINSGLGYDDAAMEEAARVTAWFDNYKLAACGLIRDVYPLNVLSEQHIAQKVGEVSLGSWIMAAGYRGRLEELSQGHRVWTIEAKDIAKVRAELAQSGLLVALARETDV